MKIRSWMFCFWVGLWVCLGAFAQDLSGVGVLVIHAPREAGISEWVTQGFRSAMIRLWDECLSSSDELDAQAHLNTDRWVQTVESLNQRIQNERIQVVKLPDPTHWKLTAEATLVPILSLIIYNPNTVFVLGVGNEGRNLASIPSKNGTLFSETGAKNVLLVAALEKPGELAPSSNYGEGVADLAAFGFRGNSESKGLVSEISETSVAAARVAHRMIQIRYSHPEWSAQEAIRYLLTHETQTQEALIDRVIQGRYLPLHPIQSRL